MFKYATKVFAADAAMTEAAPAATVEPTAVVGKNVEKVIDKLLGDNPLAVLKTDKFHFKKDELGNKRPTIELKYPVPTIDGVIAALQDQKQAKFILETLAAESYKAARQQVGAETNPVNSQEELDLSQLTLEFLANLPEAERRGGGIGKEVWEAFGKDYLEVMPGVTGKSAEQIGNAVKLLLAKLQPVKTNKKVLAFLKEQLALYIRTTENGEEYAECVEFLMGKCDALMAADEAALLSNL
jgi:hypothetical protein